MAVRRRLARLFASTMVPVLSIGLAAAQVPAAADTPTASGGP